MVAVQRSSQPGFAERGVVSAGIVVAAQRRPPPALRGLRLAFLHPCYWPEVHRGSERYIHDLGRALIARGHRPLLITSHPAWPRRSVDDGLPVIRHWRPPDGWIRRRGFDDHWSHIGFSYRTLVREDLDLAHAFFPTDALAAARWSKRRRRPALFSIMGIPNPLLRLRLDALPRAARRASLVTVDSRAVAAAVFYRYGIDTRVVYPPVDLDAFSPAGERSDEPTIICPAPIEVARKRVGLLVAAFRRLAAARPRARLTLLRPRDARVEAELASVGGIEFFDPVAEPQLLAPLYRRAWVTALPAYGEAFGMVLAESLACGTPVVASNLDAFPEIVDSPAVGRLFDGDDPPTLERALEEALALGRDASAVAACRTSAGRFSIERCADEFETLYAELVGD